MNLEISEKFNNFVKIIENKEQIEWLKQSKKIDKYEQDIQLEKSEPKIFINNCSCEISSGYESDSQVYNSSKKNINNKSDGNNEKKSLNEMIHEKISSKSKYSTTYNDELSLLEDDYFISKTENFKQTNKHLQSQPKPQPQPKLQQTLPHTNDDLIKTKSINSEFQNIFMINDNLINFKKTKKNKSSEIKDKLENIYNKIISKNLNPTKSIGFNVSEYIDINTINEKTIDNSIKKISELLEHVYKESVRGWNNEQNLFIIQMGKLNENFEKIILINSINSINQTNLINSIRMGYIYRDFNEPKIYLNNDFTKYWVGFDIDLTNNNTSTNKMIQKKYSIKDKILFYCLKNLTKSNKFKKKISKWNYKFVKKSVQIYGNKNLIVDVILFVGIKNINK